MYIVYVKVCIMHYTIQCLYANKIHNNNIIGCKSQSFTNRLGPTIINKHNNHLNDPSNTVAAIQ